ncbi:MAG: VirB3 family type IV secretion system protein [Synergistaceae bacterium]|jgi:type IV secretory pathway TrbD component|nr:VirB3 family type IV secretion system protein [Synergistaceae bacterium]
MPDAPLRQYMINQSMTKPILIMGCERNLFALSSLFCAYVGFNVGFSRGEISLVIAAIAAWFAVNFGLGLMGKADPYMSEVFRRATQYSDKPFHIQLYLPAKSSVASKPPLITKKRWM